MTTTTRVRTTITVEIAGTVIARFVNSEDAVFFADKANEAGLFSISNPGDDAHAYDFNGNMLCCPAAHRTA